MLRESLFQLDIASVRQGRAKSPSYNVTEDRLDRSGPRTETRIPLWRQRWLGRMRAPMSAGPNAYLFGKTLV